MIDNIEDMLDLHRFDANLTCLRVLKGGCVCLMSANDFEKFSNERDPGANDENNGDWHVEIRVMKAFQG